MDPLQAAQIIQTNKDHFDKMAVDGGYDSHPFVEQVSGQVAEAIRTSFTFDEDSTTLLDYACGTGQVSRRLAPHTKQIIGVDISQGMVDYYNQRVYNQGIPPEEMRAVCAQLTGADTDLDGQKFDVIVCAQAYHHFPDISAVTKILASLLKPGTGKLFVADLMTYDPSIFKHSTHGHGDHSHSHSHHDAHSHSHSHSHEQSSAAHDTHTHQGEQHTAPFQGPSVVRKGGFEASEIRDVFTAAGLVDWEFKEGVASAEMNGKRVELFLAIGRRPTT